MHSILIVAVVQLWNYISGCYTNFQKINNHNFGARRRNSTFCWISLLYNETIFVRRKGISKSRTHLASHLSSTTRKAPISRFEIAAGRRAWTRASRTWARPTSPTPSLLPSLFPASSARPWTVPKNWTGSRACPAPPTVKSHIVRDRTTRSDSNHSMITAVYYSNNTLNARILSQLANSDNSWIVHRLFLFWGEFNARATKVVEVIYIILITYIINSLSC